MSFFYGAFVKKITLFLTQTYIYHMQISKSLFLSSMAVLSAVAFWACKDEPDPRTMAKSDAPAVETATPSKLKAKVRKALGEADLQRRDTDKWAKLRIGNNVGERDRIRTAAESEAVLSVNDGSSLWISELSDITLDVEIFDSLSRNVSVAVNNGSVSFDIQKQSAKNSIRFTTGVATAAIRGTAGFVSFVNGQMVTSLKEGLVEVQSNDGKTESVSANQTTLVRKDGTVKTMKLKSSGTKALEKVISGASTESATVESIEKTLVDFDKDYAARSEAFGNKLSFRASQLSDTVWVPSVTLQARVTPGVIVTVLGESETVGENGIYQHEFDWDADAYGTKRFLASCSDGDVEIPCFMWSTVYAAPTAPSAPAVEEPAPEAAVEDAAVKAASDKEQLEKAKIKEAADKARNAAKNSEAKPAEEKPAEEKPKAEEKPAAKNLNVSVKVAGGRTEKKHLDLPANEYNTKLRFSLSGITEADVGEIASISVTRKGETVKTFSGAEIKGLSYEVPVSIDLNKIANFDIKVTLKNGKTASAKKTYEVFCFRRNHMGKARNCVQYDKAEGGGCDDKHEEEYNYAKENGLLKEE